MKDLLKSARMNKGLKITEAGRTLGIDAALISKFESGHRMPTRAQIKDLATLLDINTDELLLFWLKEKVLQQVQNEPLAEKALQLALQQVTGNVPSQEVPVSFQKLMDEMETLKNILSAPKTP